jgi:hypothetical protein
MNPALDKFSSAELRQELVERQIEARKNVANWATKQCAAIVIGDTELRATCERHIDRLSSFDEWRAE